MKQVNTAELPPVRKDPYRSSRALYVIEAALEYFISLLVAGAYLARLTTALDIPDNVTGILSSFVSLGCGFQIFAIFLADKKPVKRWVTVIHTLNQLCFCLIYVTPFFPFSTTAKTVLFIVILLCGHVLNNVANSPKINWFMSLVPDGRRGSFTAVKEIVSLLGGVVFIYVIGVVMDGFDAAGNTQGAFIVCGVCLAAMMILHSLTLVFSKEKPEPVLEKRSNGKILKELLSDKKLFKIILISVIWNVARYIAVPFFGTYQIKELGFSMTFVSLLSVLYAVCRSLFSVPLGKFADKFSFDKMLNICFAVEIVAFGINIFTVPANGKVFYTLYYMLDAVGMAGINSGAINLIYDHVQKEKRTEALALKNAFSGFAGFFTTLAISPLVQTIQSNGFLISGVGIYAQQVVSAIACFVVILLIVYLNTVVRRLKRVGEKQEAEAEQVEQLEQAEQEEPKEQAETQSDRDGGSD